MFEAMASSGVGTKQSYPNSGPGTKSLKFGNETIGYFGEVSFNELFTVTELRRQLDYFVGNDNTNTPVWVKMFIDGKVIFFPTTAFTNCFWDGLYNAGLVYGIDGNGAYPTTTPTNQLRFVKKDSSVLKVRLFKGAVADPRSHSGGVDNISTTDLLNSEWGRIRSAMLSPIPSGYTGPAWGVYPASGYFIPTTGAVSQTTRQNLLTQALLIFNDSVRVEYKTTSTPWMFVLELVPDPPYLNIEKSFGMAVEDLVPVLVGSPSYEDSLIAYRLFSGGVQMGREIQIIDTTYEDSIYRVNTSNAKMQCQEGLPVTISSVVYE